MYFLIKLFYYATEESNFLIQENGIKFLSVDKSRDVLRCNLNVSIVIGEYSQSIDFEIEALSGKGCTT